MMPRTGRGQASLETAIVVGSLALMLAGSVRIWSWLDRTIVNRQEAYNFTRQWAGEQKLLTTTSGETPEMGFSFGMPNPYKWEPLQLFTPKAPEVTPPGLGGGIQICEEGKPLYQQIQALTAEMNQKTQQATNEENAANQIAERNDLKGKSDWYQANCTNGHWVMFTCDAVQGDIQDIADQMQPHLNKAAQLSQQAKDLSDQIHSLNDQLHAMCQTLTWE